MRKYAKNLEGMRKCSIRWESVQKLWEKVLINQKSVLKIK